MNVSNLCIALFFIDDPVDNLSLFKSLVIDDDSLDKVENGIAVGTASMLEFWVITNRVRITTAGRP
jgi:hypothetical protein